MAYYSRMHKTIKNRFHYLVPVMFASIIICSVAFANTAMDTGDIPDVLVFFEPDKNTQYVILVEKETQRLFLYAYDGAYKLIFRMNCSTGEMPGTKLQSGDKKTPEGVYFFNKEFKKKYLSAIYGSHAFPMDYPNFIDRISGKNGNAIWLHGTNKPIKPRDSNGCIALENNDIDKLATFIELNRTPIIVVKKISYVSPESFNNDRQTIRQLLEKWNQALERGTYHEFLSFYSPEYVPDISRWSDWNILKKDFISSDVPFVAESKKIAIFRHKDIYLLLFEQTVKSGLSEVSVGTKKFFLTRQNDQFKIIGEEYQVLSKEIKDVETKKPFLYAALDLKSTINADREIADLVDGWIKAWSSQNIKQYGYYYARDFHFKGMNLKGWLNYKRILNQKYNKIQISKDNLVIKKGKRHSKVSFVQTYMADGYKDIGIKHLKLKREDGRWRIYRETWRKM